MSRNLPGSQGVPGRGKGVAEGEALGIPEPAETDNARAARSRDEKGSGGSDPGSAPKLSAGAQRCLLPDNPKPVRKINITKTPSSLFPLLKDPKAIPLPARE